jgi:hypothetical protein
MQDVTALRNTLIWAAGGPTEPVLDLDPVTVLDAVTEHRIAGRMLRRLQTTRTPVPERLRRILLDRVQGDMIRVHEQMRLFSRIRASVRAASPGDDVLPIKGFALFALAGDLFRVRPSNKLDLIASDPALVVQAVPDDAWSLHRGDHAFTYGVSPSIIVHNAFPVVTFPQRTRAAAFAPGAHAGVHRVPHLFGRSLITFDDFARHTAEPVVPVAGPVSAPEMAALMRCVHSYMGYTTYPGLLPIATVFLDELCQVGELVGLDSFDGQVFNTLVARHDAVLAVDFVRRLWRELLGSDPLAAVCPPGPAGDDAEPWFPQDLWWDGFSGFPVHLGWDAGELVARSDGHPDLITMLGPNRVTVHQGEEVAVPLAVDGSASARFLHYSPDHAGAVLTCRADDERLSLRVLLPGTDPGEFAAMGVVVGPHSYEIFDWPSENRSTAQAYTGSKPLADGTRCRGEAVGGRQSLSISVPWDGLGRPDRRDIRVLVRARQQRKPWNEVVRSLIVPLVVTVAD